MNIVVFFRTISLSIRNIFANKKQNLLAIATVILGSLTISTVFTVNANVNKYIDHLINKNGGPNLFVTLLNRNHFFSLKDIENLRSITTTSYIVLDSKVNASVRYDKKAINTKVTLYDTDYTKARPIKILQGQSFGSLENSNQKNNAILNSSIIEQLNIKNPIGKTVTLSFGPQKLVVNIVGIGEAQFNSNGRPKIWIPKASYSYLSNINNYDSIILGTNSYDNLTRYENLIRKTLEPQFNYQVSFYNPKLYFEKMRSEYETFIKTGAIIGLLALLGGTLGVLNLMLMGIKLRIKEIGLYRALGFPTSVVLLIFIMESIITLNIGGAIGSLLGCFSGYFISAQLISMSPFITSQAFLYGFTATFVIGLMFAYFPAKKAASLETVEALRS